MDVLILVGVILFFLPFLISLAGRGGAWKFLAFLFCAFAFVSSISPPGWSGSLFFWIIGFVFMGIALGSKASENRMQRLEQAVAKEPAAPEPFVPDGVHGGIPYRLRKDGSVDAIMQGAVVRFANMERLVFAVGAAKKPPT